MSNNDGIGKADEIVYEPDENKAFIDVLMQELKYIKIKLDTIKEKMNNDDKQMLLTDPQYLSFIKRRAEIIEMLDELWYPWRKEYFNMKNAFKLRHKKIANLFTETEENVSKLVGHLKIVNRMLDELEKDADEKDKDIELNPGYHSLMRKRHRLIKQLDSMDKNWARDFFGGIK